MLSVFIAAYREAVAFYVNQYWYQVFRNTSDAYDLKKLRKKLFYPESIKYESILSARSLKSAKTQAMGMINAATAKRYKQVWMLGELQAKGQEVANLQRKLATQPLVKPKVPKSISSELNSINCYLEASTTTFDYIFSLKSLFNKETKAELGTNSISLVIKSTRHNNKLAAEGSRLNSFLVSATGIAVRYELNAPATAGTEILAIDQGITTCLSVAKSNGSTEQSQRCAHGHDLASIIHTLARKKRGSKAFRRAQRHRTNYINWAVNQLDLNDVSEIRLEKISDMRRGQPTSRFLSHFAYTEIRTKLESAAERNGVRFVQQSNEYRSQRCSTCGFVHKKNRSGKTFTCGSCGEIQDADLNAAMNHLADLPEISRDQVGFLSRTTGFLWNPVCEGPYSALK